jgi:hypothetical protein
MLAAYRVYADYNFVQRPRSEADSDAITGSRVVTILGLDRPPQAGRAHLVSADRPAGRSFGLSPRGDPVDPRSPETTEVLRK